MPDALEESPSDADGTSMRHKRAPGVASGDQDQRKDEVADRSSSILLYYGSIAQSRDISARYTVDFAIDRASIGLHASSPNGGSVRMRHF